MVEVAMNINPQDEILHAQIVSITGNPVTSTPMMGVGGPGILKVQGPKGEAVLKYTTAIEAAFYKDWADIVRHKGLGVPEVYAQGESAGKIWVLMESLPMVLGHPYTQRLSDQIAYLSVLHSLDQNPIAMAGNLPERSVMWTAQDIDDAASLWDDDDAHALTSFLEMPWPALTSKKTLISGDPNPTNWGERSTGQLVLFDWAEAAWSHPAYDLAVLCGGFPENTAVKHVVKQYLDRYEIPTKDDIDQWMSWVLTAKLVSYVWFAAWWRRGQMTTAARPGITMLQNGLLSWIRSIRQKVSPFVA